MATPRMSVANAGCCDDGRRGRWRQRQHVGKPGAKRPPAGATVTLGTVIRDRLVQTIERSEFASVLNVLMSGDDGEINEVRTLQLLADRGGTNVTSRPTAKRYGFSSHSRVRPALMRLQRRGLVDERDTGWYIVDPLFEEWLRRASPLADQPVSVEAQDE